VARASDFALRIAKHPMPLETRFDALVDGTDGDTYLDDVEAMLRNTPIFASGKIVGTPGEKGRTIELNVRIEGGRIEDLLELLVAGERVPMRGGVSLDTWFLLPPGDRDVSDKLELRGTIYDTVPPPPPVDELRSIALESRPDIISYRLGVQRAEADVRLARANRYSNPYLLFQPYTYQDNAPYGVRSAVSYALGVTVPLPVFNRNQGGVQRAVLNVTQTQIELSETERQALVDVEKAVQEYDVSRREVNELANDVIPAAKQVRDEAFRLLGAGEKSLVEYIAAQLEFNQIAKQYLDTAIRHRRSMVNLNTVTGKRILP